MVEPASVVLDPRTTEAVVFDAYGTLFDVHAAVMARADAIGPQARALSDLWRAKQLEYSWVYSLAGRYVPFWTLTERALHALARYPAVDSGIRKTLLAAYRELDAFADAAPCLERLRAGGLKTAILSNGDPAMLADAVAAAGFATRFDAVISVEDAQVFKTAPDAYRLVEARIGVPAQRTLFVSSNRWDVAGAAAFGLAPVWINRAGLPDEYPDLPPVAIVASLDALCLSPSGRSPARRPGSPPAPPRRGNGRRARHAR